MNNPLEAALRGTIRGQAERIKRLEESVSCWASYGLAMTACCIVLTALYYLHCKQHAL